VLSHISLGTYYKTMFAMAQHHKYSIADLEQLLPYERDLYVDMLLDHIEDQKQKNR
jgi:hypothetical protein